MQSRPPRSENPRTAQRARAALALAICGICACVPSGLRRWREPEHAWFQFYPGPLRPLDQVAVLCRESDGLDVVTIRRSADAYPAPARHEKWHFPECIEALPGSYALEVGYFSRDTHFESTATITETMESPVPMAAEWVAEAGGLYLLRARLGRMAPLPGLKPRSPRESATTEGRWYLRSWSLAIERLASWDQLAEPLREYREAWRRYRPGS